MTNITSTLVEALTLHYSTEWPTGIIGNNESHEVDTLSFIITPLALISKHGKQHHPHLENVSLVLLSSEWTRLTRLIFLTILSVIGSVGNIFMISSVMIEDHLKKAGNSLIVNSGLSDLAVSIVIFPISIINLLAMSKDDDLASLSVCKFQWFLAACTFLISVLTLTATSIENYMRLCTTQEGPQWFGRSNVTAIILLIWLIGCVASGLQYGYDVSFDYCNRPNNKKLLPIETGVIVTLILVPLLITFLVHIRIIIDAKRFMSQPSFKKSAAYKSDFSLVRSNFYSFLTFVLFWLPFAIVFAISFSTSPQHISDKMFYYTVWVGLSKSCFHNIIYCITNRHFRNAYFNLFNYCCCKTTVSTARRRQADPSAATRSDVRVHIIPGYNMYSYTSPQRAGNHSHWAKRDCHEL